MKLFYSICILLLFNNLSSSGQVQKYYVTKKGVVSADPTKAESYMTVEKLEDSVYLMRQYSMRDTILMQGYYADAEMKTPNGKFTYYFKDQSTDSIITSVVHKDTNNYIKKVGFFVKGVKEGMWLEYERRNLKNCMYMYQRGKLNGMFQYFSVFHDHNVIEEGNYIDDKKDGEWKKYGFDSLNTPLTSDFYAKGKLIKHIDHFKKSNLSDALGKYLIKRIKKLDTVSEVSVAFILNGDGKITKPKLMKSVTPELDKEIMKAYLEAPLFKPNLYDGKPIARKMTSHLFPIQYQNGVKDHEMVVREEEFGKLWSPLGAIALAF